MQTEANEYRLHDPNEHKYSDGFARFVDENDLYDAEDGNVESPMGWFGLAGRNVLVHDDRGFVTRYRHMTRAEAADAFALLQYEYSDWSHECEYPCWVCGKDDHCGCVCSICDVCNDYHPADQSQYRHPQEEEG